MCSLVIGMSVVTEGKDLSLKRGGKFDLNLIRNPIVEVVVPAK
jgi:hypothetical protein